MTRYSDSLGVSVEDSRASGVMAVKQAVGCVLRAFRGIRSLDPCGRPHFFGIHDPHPLKAQVACFHVRLRHMSRIVFSLTPYARATWVAGSFESSILDRKIWRAWLTPRQDLGLMHIGSWPTEVWMFRDGSSSTKMDSTVLEMQFMCGFAGF